MFDHRFWQKSYSPTSLFCMIIKIYFFIIPEKDLVQAEKFSKIEHSNCTCITTYSLCFMQALNQCFDPFDYRINFTISSDYQIILDGAWYH